MSQQQNSGTSDRQWWLWFAWEISALIAGAIGGVLNMLRFRLAPQDDRIMFGMIGLTVVVMGLVMQLCLRHQWPRWDWPSVVEIIVGGIVFGAVFSVVQYRWIMTVIWQYQELRGNIAVLMVLYTTSMVGLLISLVSIIVAVPMSLLSSNIRSEGFKSWHLALLTLPTAMMVHVSPYSLTAIPGMKMSEMAFPLLGLIAGGCGALFGGILIVYCGVAGQTRSVSVPEA